MRLFRRKRKSGWAGLDRPQWTDDELRLLFEVAQCDDEGGLIPHDQFYPVAERLRERGVLNRRMVDGRPAYTTTAGFRERAALHLHRAEAERQASWN
jgi:hypothetical protein